MNQRLRRSTAATACFLLALAGCSRAADVADHTDGSTTSTSQPTSQATSTAPVDPTTTGKTEPTPPASTDDVVIPSPRELKAGRSTPVEDPYYPDTSNPEFDALHYFLDLQWDGDTLTGLATITFRPTQRVDDFRLDLAAALEVGSVRLDGKDVDFTRQDDGLRVAAKGLDPGITHRVVIGYAGQPEPTPAPSRRADMTEGIGWSVSADGSVYAFQEPYGAFTWYPVNDHPSDEALYDARITTDGDDVGVFNGEFLGASESRGQTVARWHVDEPLASYLATIAIGPYTEYVDTTPSGMQISYWLRPTDRDLLAGLEEEGAESFEWLEKHAGEYPFSTLGVVVVDGSSAMETQTMITMSRGAVLRPDAVLAHEMAHQWYGNSVTPRDWKGMWLNEGWAMYMQQWFETDTGRPPYAGGISQWRSYDNQSRLSSGPPGDYDPMSFADTNVYLGPAMMLDEIRKRIGDEAFEQLVKDWPAEHENENVDRETFTRWVNDKTGRNLTPLIDRWLDSPQTPRPS